MVLEDVREASGILSENGYAVTRLTHAELLSASGDITLGKLLNGEFSMLWIMTPIDWSVKPRERRTSTLYTRIANWITRASKLQMIIVFMGPPSHYLWKNNGILEAMTQAQLRTTKMRFCRVGDKADEANDAPSGTYIKVSTTLPLDLNKWSCRCKCDMQHHVLDWYGHDPKHGEWRSKMRLKYANIFFREVVLDNVSLSLAIGDSHVFQNTSVTPVAQVQTGACPKCSCKSCCIFLAC